MINFWKKNRKKAFLFTTRNIAEHTPNGERISDRSQTYTGTLQSVEGWANSSVVTSFNTIEVGSVGIKGTAKNKDERKEVQPKEVFEEIKREDPEISFDNLDQKIAAVGERIKILSEHLDESHLMDEHRALFYLKNRRKYLDTRKKSPIDWAITTREAVEDLCSRYKLRVVPLKQYYTTVPKDGIKEIARHTKAYKAITGDTPIFELVIKDASALPEEKAKETRKKDRDPILLANSPLGNHLYVLGAWDDEVAIVDEIIYSGK